MFGRVDAGLPRLDAFDEGVRTGPRYDSARAAARDGLAPGPRSAWCWRGVIASALALAWPPPDGRQDGEIRVGVRRRASRGRDGADDQVTRLLREIAVLKHQIKQLTSAQQQAAETIAGLEAAAQRFTLSAAGVLVFGPRCLTFGFASPAEPGIVESSDGARRPPDLRGAYEIGRCSQARERRAYVDWTRRRTDRTRTA